MNREADRSNQATKWGAGVRKEARTRPHRSTRTLQQSEVPILAQCIRQALQGHFPSQRLMMDLLDRSPRHRFISSRLGKVQNAEDLQGAMEVMLQQMSRGDVAPTDAREIMKGLAQMGQILQQRANEQQSQRTPKQVLPDFMREALEDARNSRLHRQAQKKAPEMAHTPV
jgi:hypothetical protein